MESPHENRARPAERSDVQLARAGDEAAFERLVARHRPVLLAHCYSMVGSLPDAEDAVQEALVRAWRAHSGSRCWHAR